MPNPFALRPFCKWPSCVRPVAASGEKHCDEHKLIAGQHETSHLLEGHSNSRIDGCPVCQDPDGWLRQQYLAASYAKWEDHCPARGPGLRHAHWKECQSTHPGTSVHHALGQCCHCERSIG